MSISNACLTHVKAEISVLQTNATL